ncbi:MAG: penicillin-binding transpeptidase domain-containing protein [Limisphaerales bacterium]
MVSENAARQMIEALKTVPMKGGTAPEAQLKNYVVAGKTGTAQVAENGHYVPGKFVSSLYRLFPGGQSELCISWWWRSRRKMAITAAKSAVRSSAKSPSAAPAI